jgi:hypothetical protein
MSTDVEYLSFPDPSHRGRSRNDRASSCITQSEHAMIYAPLRIEPDANISLLLSLVSARWKDPFAVVGVDSLHIYHTLPKKKRKMMKSKKR